MLQYRQQANKVYGIGKMNKIPGQITVNGKLCDLALMDRVQSQPANHARTPTTKTPGFETLRGPIRALAESATTIGEYSQWLVFAFDDPDITRDALKVARIHLSALHDASRLKTRSRQLSKTSFAVSFKRLGVRK